MQKWLVNGHGSAAICPDDRGLTYGDGLFETIAIRRGRPRFLERHLTRLGSGCRRLAIPAPDPQLIEEQIKALTAGHGAGTVKVIVTRGVGERGYAPPERPHPTLAVGFSAANTPLADGTFEEGLAAVTCSVAMSGNRLLAGLKTLNRLDSVMARAECVSKGAAEGIMGGPSGQVIGGTMSNLFLVGRSGLVTPALNDAGILGIMRAVVLDVAAEIGIPVSETRINPAELLNAEELFLTNSLMGIRPVRQLDDKRFGIGPVTRALAAGLLAIGVEECA